MARGRSFTAAREASTTMPLARIVKRYLEALSRGETTTEGAHNGVMLRERITGIHQELATATPLRRVELMEEEALLREELVVERKTNFAEMEAAFVEFGAKYARRMSISYEAFRKVGVSKEILERAGIEPSPKKKKPKR